MARVKGGIVVRRRHKGILKAARGFNQGRHRLYRRANESVLKSRAAAYRGRRDRKREFRRLWIARINAGARAHGLTYSRLMHGLEVAGVALNRKVLADLAVRDPSAFGRLVEVARSA